MDDYNVSVLSEAKNEYSLRLVNILTPLILEGIKSILKEAWQLCLENDEEVKYLMTFQNFLSRVTKWNQTIIDEETARILAKSGCSYLEDLLTCVHITQLKILTSIRVSQKQKKSSLIYPNYLNSFIRHTLNVPASFIPTSIFLNKKFRLCNIRKICANVKQFAKIAFWMSSAIICPLNIFCVPIWTKVSRKR